VLRKVAAQLLIPLFSASLFASKSRVVKCANLGNTSFRVEFRRVLKISIARSRTIISDAKSPLFRKIIAKRS
jgi:hypothetical protein